MKRGLRRLIRTLITLSVIFFLLIGLPLILFHMKSAAPTEDYDEEVENGFFQALDDNLSALILDEEEDNFTLRVTDAFINRMIQKQLSSGNPKYLDPSFDGEPEHDYMMVAAGFVGLKGVWTTLTDDQLTITAGADVLISGTPVYQTGLELAFNIVLSEDDQYFLQIDKIQIGSMKLPKQAAFDFASSIVKAITSKSLNDMIAEQLSFGQFDEEELSLVVGEEGLTEYLYGIDPTFAAMLKLVYQESLLTLDISDGGFDVELNIGVFRRLLTDPDQPAFTPWEDEADKAAFMASFAAQAAINAVMNPTDPYIDLTESDINAILDYTLEEDVRFELPIEFTLDGADVEYTFASTNLFLCLDDDVLSAHLRMGLTKTGMAGSFDMQFNLTTNVDMNASGDMVLTVIESNLGEVDIDQAMLAALIATFDDNLMVDNTLVIPKEKVNEMFEGSGVVISDSYVLNSQLRLHYDLEA
ncbi:MAG: hypothetical protein WC399_01010 [Bacilli bacterium]